MGDTIVENNNLHKWISINKGTQYPTDVKSTIDVLRDLPVIKNNPNLLQRLGRVEGLYSAYQLSSSGAIMEAIVAELGGIIVDISVPTVVSVTNNSYSAYFGSNPSNLIFFDSFIKSLNGKNIDIRYLIDAFEHFLKSREKSANTIRIYVNSIKNVLAPNDIRDEDIYININLEELICILQEELVKLRDRQRDGENVHNIISAIKLMLEFLSILRSILEENKNI